MKVLLIGATGYVGSSLLSEALARGHQVTALVRDPSRLPSHPNLSVGGADVYQPASLVQAMRGQDAVISAFSPGLSDPQLIEHHVAAVRAILSAASESKVRLLMVGGAGSLEVAPGKQLVDTPEFPAQWKATALATREALQLLQREPTLDWTFLCPAAQLEPGTRSGHYRVGGNALLTNAKGESRISVQDYAVAMIDELEKPRHPRQRFTVAAA